ncbi:17313_t:CDS:2 [Dentiscutata erythropus]|uniref:17313_t:CDS:1 n=1 Tax=Dentiscutata erythropus TaxID=1348616 RepID=A0A9N9CLB5_9GLOM|nr:17313_t:CDS:2 [Dentiscutata erythropus]
MNVYECRREINFIGDYIDYGWNERSYRDIIITSYHRQELEQ